MTLREKRLARHIAARGDEGLVEALLELKGTVIGSRYRCDSLYDVGGEGAVFLVTDRLQPYGEPLVAKVPLLPFHRPFDMTQAKIAQRREVIALEARYLAHSGAPSLPRHVGTYAFRNPLIDARRGGEFEALDPAVVMQKLPGQDLDRWLARAHRSEVPLQALRPTLDRVAVGLLRALVDLLHRNLLYVDLRPANLRMIRQPKRHVRLLDAGSLVRFHERTGRFPHVPSYLPPATLNAMESGGPVRPTAAIQSIMCGRTLYEIATGQVPRAGEPIDESALTNSRVSEPIADVVLGLASGRYKRVDEALDDLTERARAAAARRLESVRSTVTSSMATAPTAATARPRGVPPVRVPARSQRPARRSLARRIWLGTRALLDRFLPGARSRGPRAPV